MAGCYTHITVVSKILDKRELESIGLDTRISKMLREWSNYVKLGAVSPDLPYLGFGKKWADKFHYEKTSQIVREGLDALFDKSFDDVHAQKQLAWLFGYAAHLVTDLYLHPVIEKKVGPYAENKNEHRICEMNQDAWVLKKEMHDDVGRGEIFDNTIKTCTETGAEGYIVDNAISEFWNLLIEKVYSSRRGPSPDKWFASFSEFWQMLIKKVCSPWWSPSPNKWFASFVALMDKFAENPGKHLIITRTLLKNFHYGYPSEPDSDYVDNLHRPNGECVDFHTVFNEAVEKVKEYWAQMANALSTKDVSCFTLPDGNLDTGKRLSVPETSIFWEE